MCVNMSKPDNTESVFKSLCSPTSSFKSFNYTHKLEHTHRKRGGEEGRRMSSVSLLYFLTMIFCCNINLSGTCAQTFLTFHAPCSVVLIVSHNTHTHMHTLMHIHLKVTSALIKSELKE